MAAAVAAPPVGDQRPRIGCVPSDVAANSAQDAIDLASACGLELDEWQQHVLRQSLGEREDGLWSAYDVGLVVARQNGKGAVLMARELAGALLFGERLIIHSAHELDTARDHMQKLYELVLMSPFLQQYLDPTETTGSFKWGRGYEQVTFSNGAVIRFKSRTRKGGRGLSGDLVVFDEAFELEDVTVGAMQPLLRARPNPQLWYASSTVDQTTMPNCHVLAGLRHRAKSDSPGRLAYLEWSNPDDMIDGLSAGEIHDAISDPDAHCRANPALGIRITHEQIRTEIDSMSLRQFAVECLSVGDWPSTTLDGAGSGPLDLDRWGEAEDQGAVLPRAVVVGVGVAPDRDCASVGVAGRRDDGKVHGEVVASGAGVRWTVDEVKRLEESLNTDVLRVVVDGKSDLAEPIRKIVGAARLVVTSASDVATGCARVVDLNNEGRFVHIGQHELDTAASITETRRAGGGFAWKRPDGGDVTPLEAVSAATFGLDPQDRQPREPIAIVT